MAIETNMFVFCGDEFEFNTSLQVRGLQNQNILKICDLSIDLDETFNIILIIKDVELEIFKYFKLIN